MSEQTQTLIGGKTVSEKYTIKERSKNGQHGRTQLFEGSKQKFIGSFEEYDKAKEIMDILNEDEKRKRQPKIDEAIKNELLDDLRKNYLIAKRITDGGKCQDDYKNAIYIIESLDAE